MSPVQNIFKKDISSTCESSITENMSEQKKRELIIFFN